VGSPVHSWIRDWQADYTPKSLEKLGQWFYEHVETRKRTEKEKETIYGKAPKWFKSVKIKDWELTNQTFSLAIDIGMYLNRALEKNVPGLKWELVRKPKSDVDFQQPVLVGTGNLVFNPTQILVTYAYGVARGSKEPERLKELCAIWVNMLVK